MRFVRKLPLLVLATLLAFPAFAMSGGLAVEGTISAVDGNLVSLNGGIVVVDVTHATILARGDGASPGVAALIVGAPLLATISGKGSDGSLIATTVLVGTPEAIELRGKLDAVDTTAGTLSLLGMTVATDAHTAFTGSTSRGPVHALADLAAGDSVEVEAIRSGSGLLAQQVHAEPAPPPPPPPGTHPVDFVGHVDAIGTDSWTISGKTVVVTSTTRISGSPAVGDLVRVRATIASDKTITALSIEKISVPAVQFREIHGKLEVKNADSWTISGTVVKITSATKIKNDPKVGDQVGGLAKVETDGSLTGIILVGMGMGGSGGGHH